MQQFTFPGAWSSLTALFLDSVFLIHALNHFKILVPVSKTTGPCSGYSCVTGLIAIHELFITLPGQFP